MFITLYHLVCLRLLTFSLSSAVSFVAIYPFFCFVFFKSPDPIRVVIV